MEGVERFWIWAIQMNNLRSSLGKRRIGGISNEKVRKLCFEEGVDEIFRFFGYIKRMDNSKVAERVDERERVQEVV